MESLRAFLADFKMPGESMLIERLMASFARRFYENNPGFVAHLTSEKIASLRASYAPTISLCGVSVDSLLLV